MESLLLLLILSRLTVAVAMMATAPLSHHPHHPLFLQLQPIQPQRRHLQRVIPDSLGFLGQVLELLAFGEEARIEGAGGDGGEGPVFDAGFGTLFGFFVGSCSCGSGSGSGS